LTRQVRATYREALAVPLKIATIAPSYYPAHSYGGPIRSTLQLAQGLVRVGCEVRVLTTNTAGKRDELTVETAKEHTLAGGVRVRYARRLLPESVAPQLLALLPEYIAWCDIVHLVGNYNFPTFPTLLAARLADKPLFWSPRGAFQRWSGAQKPQLKAAFEQICRRLLPRTSVLHVTSEEEGRESAARLGGVPYVMIPNGVPFPEAPRHEPSPGSLRIVYLGRLDPKKGIPNLLGACALLPSLGLSRFELTIAGGGEPDYEQFLHAQRRTLGLAQEVRFTGELPDEAKADFFAQADLLVMPSHTENFGIVAAEALAHAVPVIASLATPWSQLVEHDCGLWVENTPEALARAIVQLSQRDLRALGQRGRNMVQQTYSWNHLCARMLTSYEATLAAHQSLR
jgi:glycosyltransferase involved in cell wall biosynthesis